MPEVRLWGLLRFCSVTSLLICVAICALWLTSYGESPTELRFRVFAAEWRAASFDGRLWVDDWPDVQPQRDRYWRAFDHAQRKMDEYLDGYQATPPSIEKELTFDALQTQIARIEQVRDPDVRTVVRTRHRPLAFIFGAGAVGGWIVGKLRSRAVSRLVATGRCAACGYDLRATPDRCPECGAGVTASPSRPAQ